MTDSVDSPLLLDTLSRFEKQVEACCDRKTLVNLFCIQIIPFLLNHSLLKPLRDKWQKEYQELLDQAVSFEKDALNEVKQVFSQLVSVLNKRKPSIAKKMAYIQQILAGDPKAGFSAWPLYRVIYFELKELLQMALENGEIEVCQQYAVLGKMQKHKVHPKKKAKIVEETFIEIYTFAPSVEKASQTLNAIHWDQLQNPAVTWGYFEFALWNWHTSNSYFETTPELLKKKDQNPLPALSQKSAWLEIASIRNSVHMNHQPIIFKNQLFQEGMKTLMNEITIFASQGFQFEEKQDDPMSKVIFELRLEENQLWVFVHMDQSEPRKYYLKRFYYEAVDGLKKSGPYEFVQKLLQDHSEGGYVEVKLPKKSDSIPKMIDRIGLNGVLRGLFFGPSQGTRVPFKGARVAMDRDEKCRKLLEELSFLHEKGGEPE